LFTEPVQRIALGRNAQREHLERFLSPAAAPLPGDPDLPPFRSGWFATVSYDFGSRLEPRAQGAAPPTVAHDLSQWPLAEFHRAEWCLAFDRLRSRWWFAGNPDLAPDGLSPTDPAPFRTRDLAPETTRAEYTARVAAALDLIRAGDVYQVNLTHALTARFAGSARGLYLALARAAQPWYGAYLEADDLACRRAFLSVSPELFLAYDARSRLLTARPMKGTRRDANASTLRDSPKENAELTMIVDLMRNDLGRVCEPGTVRVAVPRDIEHHGAGAAALLQATATIQGRLRGELAPGAILGATFPGGSITGAPKVRAMQIIEDLERSARGPYCGAHGFIDDSGSFSLAMSIRTALLTGEPGAENDEFLNAYLRYGVGAGIVADSDPDAEWLETLDKAAVLERATGLTLPR
ncbi:MAG: anthranilate synthase component I family protein, partial [Phycisphaerales bacterium]